jgi:hypothetical protein
MAASKKPLTKFDPVRKERFVHYLMLGHHPNNAVKLSGFDRNLKGTVEMLMNDDYVRDLLIAYRDELRKRLRVDREKVTEMTMDTYDLAKLQGDPRGMIGAVQELSKIYGLYAPDEVRVTNVKDDGKNELRKNLKSLSDDELLKLATETEGAEILDAEFVELDPVRSDE